MMYDEFSGDFDWRAMRHRARFEMMANARAKRGDIKPLILQVLLDKPMHGYEIMSELENRSQGRWRPSPGSIYPMLQLLVDQGSVSCVDEDGKKTYSLTEAGREEAKKADVKKPWEHDADKHEKFFALREVGMDIFQELRKIAHEGNDEDIERVRTILERTRDELRAIRKAQT
jgi:DNA-binding PadR family transcriptional regulator